MALPRLLLRVVDPAQAYVDRHLGPPHRGPAPLHREAVVFGPGVPGGSRDATAEELAALAETAARRRTEVAVAMADVERRWAPQLRRAAQELLDTGAARMVLGDRTVDARVLRFWRGDHLLHTATRGPAGGGESLSRISRDPRRGGADVLVGYLVRAAATA